MPRAAHANTSQVSCWLHTAFRMDFLLPLWLRVRNVILKMPCVLDTGQGKDIRKFRNRLCAQPATWVVAFWLDCIFPFKLTTKATVEHYGNYLLRPDLAWQSLNCVWTASLGISMPFICKPGWRICPLDNIGTNKL